MEKRGSIAFCAEGLSIEKLIRLCSDQGLALHRVKRTGVKSIRGCCAAAQYERLSEICTERGWRLKRLGYMGWRVWWEKAKKHGVGLAAGGLAMGLIAVAMLFVWQIRVENAGVYEGDLRKYVRDAGIHVGMLKGQVDVKELCSELEWRYPQVAWVQGEWAGSTLVIRVVEGVATPEVASYGETGDVVAVRGGVILSVEPMGGTVMVKPGDVVTPGQILIKGEEKRGEGELVPVKARGCVWARVWDRAGVTIPVDQIISEPTGQTATVWEIRLPWKSICLDEPSAYEVADLHVQQMPVGGCWWPVWIRQSRYEEVTIRREPRALEEVEAEAGEKAMSLLRQKVGLSDELVDKWIDYCMIEGGKLAAYATAERRADIGAFVPHSQNTASR